MSADMQGVVRTPGVFPCLECGCTLSAIGTADGADGRPSPGDAIVCLKCGAVMTCNRDYSLRPFTDAERKEIANDRAYMNQLARFVRGVHFLKHQAG